MSQPTSCQGVSSPPGKYSLKCHHVEFDVVYAAFPPKEALLPSCYMSGATYEIENRKWKIF